MSASSDSTPLDSGGPTRRDVLGVLAGAVGAAAWAGGAAAQQQGVPAFITQQLGEGQRFEPAAVVELARALSRRPFAPIPNDLPDPFNGLNYERYVEIRSTPQNMIWAGENRGFTVEPLHRGFVFTNPVVLFLIEDGQVRRVAYDRGRFDYGKLNPPQTVPDLAFSGFRLHSTFGNTHLAECALFQGASFFRAIARGQGYGVVARALTLRPAEARGEEFPMFRAFWIERPQAGTNAIAIHGLLDSESTTGAVRMTLRPGDATIVDVETVLFPRVNLDHVGFGGMASTYLFGGNDRRGVDDARPNVFKSAGVQMHNGSDEWLWRPLSNPETLQIAAFLDRNPRGFGLLQRDRDYAAFQDDDQRYERRPSLWIEPIGEWGQGQVQLIEIPSDSEINDNILAYWRPRGPLAAGSEVAFAYRQFWCWTPPARPPLATVTNTRTGRAGGGARRRRFFVDFASDAFTAQTPWGEIRAALTTTPGQIHNLRIVPYPERKTARVLFDLDPGPENACELRLVLESGGKAASETWLYRWTP